MISRVEKRTVHEIVLRFVQKKGVVVVYKGLNGYKKALRILFSAGYGKIL
jgi:hypothetical protein